MYLIDQLPNGLFVEAHIGDGGEQALDHQPPSPLIRIRGIIYRTGQSNQSASQLILKLRHLSGFAADAGFFRYNRRSLPSAHTENQNILLSIVVRLLLLLVQDLHLRVLLPNFSRSALQISLPTWASLLLTVFNELVRLKQRRGADLAAEKADALIPCQQLEHRPARRFPRRGYMPLPAPAPIKSP